ncbi:hypothetical protein NM208_g7365 [Fusarium decemcellulare]|uniref:Uncharacterized protein n=1 Tax=Fusarium decemcellulare TaxID=57161 RepID=A0ACC1S9P8_9HYPO|nr:hypothetical protein NM208_g7365 [Fusarium decemcellulare]
MRLASLLLSLSALAEAAFPELPEMGNSNTTIATEPPQDATSLPVDSLPTTTSSFSSSAPVIEETTTTTEDLIGETTTTTTDVLQETTTTGPAEDTTTTATSSDETITTDLTQETTTTTTGPEGTTTTSEQPLEETTTTSTDPVDQTTTTTQGPVDETTTTTEEQAQESTTTTTGPSEPEETTTSDKETITSKAEAPESTTSEGKAPISIPDESKITPDPSSITAEPKETIEGVTDNTLHTTEKDGHETVVPVLFGPSCLMFCDHAGDDGGPGGIDPDLEATFFPPLPGITPAPSAVIISNGVPTPVNLQTPEDEQEDDDDKNSTEEEETKTEESTSETSVASTTEETTTATSEAAVSYGLKTVVIDDEPTITSEATSTDTATSTETSETTATTETSVEAVSYGLETVVIDDEPSVTESSTEVSSTETTTTEESTTETSTESTQTDAVSYGLETVVIDVDPTVTETGTETTEETTTEESTTETTTSVPSTLQTTTRKSEESTEIGATDEATTEFTTTTSDAPERTYFPCIVRAGPNVEQPYCQCETTVDGKGYYVSTSLISSKCDAYTEFPSEIPTGTDEQPEVTEPPEPEPITKTEDGTVLSYPDRTIGVVNYPGGKVTVTKGVGDPVTLETPLPTQTDANNKGSSQCGSIDDACSRALDGFEDDTIYKDYVSRYARIKSGIIVVASFGQAGCTAQFKCDDYGLGMSGKHIKEAVDYMKENNDVSKCGTAYLSNTCQITLNYCTNCHHDG